LFFEAGLALLLRLASNSWPLQWSSCLNHLQSMDYRCAACAAPCPTYFVCFL
jgi:hypothetical protein